MNRALLTVRKVKGLTQQKMADLLGVELTAYKELECAFIQVTPEFSVQLEERFHVPGEYFMAYNQKAYSKDYIKLLKKQKLDLQKYPGISVETNIAIATLALDAIMANQELATAYAALLDMQMQYEALRDMYNSVKKAVPAS